MRHIISLLTAVFLFGISVSGAAQAQVDTQELGKEFHAAYSSNRYTDALDYDKALPCLGTIVLMSGGIFNTPQTYQKIHPEINELHLQALWLHWLKIYEVNNNGELPQSLNFEIVEEARAQWNAANAGDDKNLVLMKKLGACYVDRAWRSRMKTGSLLRNFLVAANMLPPQWSVSEQLRAQRRKKIVDTTTTQCTELPPKLDVASDVSPEEFDAALNTAYASIDYLLPEQAKVDKCYNNGGYPIDYGYTYDSLGGWVVGCEITCEFFHD